MLRTLLSLIAFTALLWTAGLVAFINSIPTRSLEPNAKTDAIVVLTGGEGRVEYGFQLMEQGHARTLFISGVGKGVTRDDLLSSYASKLLKHSIGDGLVLDHAANDTHANAMETARFMKERGYRSMRLVTAGYHMKRSLYECRQLMPEVHIVADPVSPLAFRRDNWWRDDTTRHLVLSEYHKYGLVWLRSLIGQTL